MTDEEIIAYALAHFYATVEIENDHRVYELLLDAGSAIGVDVPAGDEYQRAVLHHFDPERVHDFPLEDG